MNLLPPWKLAEREEWAEARPWLAGLYFGLLMSCSPPSTSLSLRPDLRV